MPKRAGRWKSAGVTPGRRPGGVLRLGTLARRRRARALDAVEIDAPDGAAAARLRRRARQGSASAARQPPGRSRRVPLETGAVPARVDAHRAAVAVRRDATRASKSDAERAHLELEVVGRRRRAGRQEDLDDLLGPERGVALAERAPGVVVAQSKSIPRQLAVEARARPGSASAARCHPRRAPGRASTRVAGGPGGRPEPPVRPPDLTPRGRAASADARARRRRARRRAGLGGVLDLDLAVPVVGRPDRDRGAAAAVLEAAGAGDEHGLLETALAHQVLEAMVEVEAAAGAAARLGSAGRALVGADQEVEVGAGHGRESRAPAPASAGRRPGRQVPGHAVGWRSRSDPQGVGAPRRDPPQRVVARRRLPMARSRE